MPKTETPLPRSATFVPILVAPDEVTCCTCGETFPGSWRRCPRCTSDDEEDEDGESPSPSERAHSRWGPPTPAVPTISYLRDGEYVLA